MPKPADTTSPAYHGAQALRAAADELPPIWIPHGATMSDPCGGEYDGAQEHRDWLRQRANQMHPYSDPEGIALVQRITDTIDGDPSALEAAAAAKAMAAARPTFTNEKQLQEALDDALRAADVTASREFKLYGDAGRIDFLTLEGVGIEVKIKGAWADVVRQLTRYANSPEVTRLILVTTKTEHTRTIPRVIGGKQVAFVLLRDGFGVIC